MGSDVEKPYSNYAEIDIFDDGETLATFADNSVQYVISSHVFEHLPNPIKALYTWNRVVKSGGYVFMIVPQRDAHPPDGYRLLSTYREWSEAYTEGWTPETMPAQRTIDAGGSRGHYFVYSPETLKEMIRNLCIQDYRPLNWELVGEENPDKKAGNGFTLVYKVTKAEPIILDTAGNGIPDVTEKLIARHAAQDPQLFAPQHPEGADTDVIDEKPKAKKRRGGKVAK